MTAQDALPLDGATIAVVGAGVAGLTAAIAFARRGAAVTVVEQADAISPIGAGLQLSPNATRILRALGVLEPIEKLWHEPDHVRLVSGRDLSVLARVPAGAFARSRWGAPYGVLHRSVLQKALLDAATSACRVVLGRPVRSSSESRLREDIGGIVGKEPDLIVGADGVWSNVRRVVPDHGTARFSGYVAWRMTLEDTPGRRPFDRQATTAFLGPSSHLVAYPLASTGALNLVAITRGRNPGESWGEAQDRAATRLPTDAFRAWHPDIRAVISNAHETSCWPLFEVAEGSWTNGSDIVLIGDAAHAMMPFAAQGAAMAIEDAFELASVVSRSGSAAIASALAGFVARRRKRTAQVRNRTAFNRFAYHARGPIRLGRDLVLALRGSESLAADLDWLYGYRADGL